MGKDSNTLLMGHFIAVTIRWTSSLVKDYFIGMKTKNIKVAGNMVIFMGWELKHLKMGQNIQEIGGMEFLMDMVKLSTKMGVSTVETGEMDNHMDKAQNIMPMTNPNTKENGQVVAQMALGKKKLMEIFTPDNGFQMS